MLNDYRVAAIQFEPRLGARAENIARLLELTETAAHGGARLIVLPEDDPVPTGRRSAVAVAQLAPSPGDYAGNLALIEQALAGLRNRSERRDGTCADLVVFPEYALTGCPDAEHLEIALAEEDLSGWRDRLVDLARQYDTHMVVGFAEYSRAQIFSAALLAGPAGIVASYRKTHIVGAETAWCSRGTEKPPVLDLPLGRVGMLIGADLCFPEPSRTLAIAGCDLIAVAAGPGLPPVAPGGPTRIPLSPPGIAVADPYHFHLARQRPFENNYYLAFASLSPPHGIGRSAVFGPVPGCRTGETVLDSDDGVAVGTIDTSNLDTPYPSSPARAKDLVRMRQIHLYDPLQS